VIDEKDRNGHIASLHMMIVSGTSAKEKKLGHVADFCQTCQAITPFLVTQNKIWEHLYFVPFGSAVVTGHIATCQTCKISINTNAICYSDFVKPAGHNIESMITATFPNVREIHSGRLALAKILHDGQLKNAEREIMLTNVWLNFATAHEQSVGKGIQIHGPGAKCLLVTFLFTFAGLIASPFVPRDHVGNLFQAIGIIALIGIIYSIILFIRQPGQVKRELLQRIAHTLKPFSITREEIGTYLVRLTRSGYRLGKKIKPDALIAEIMTEGDADSRLRH
jgi:hypothetical protein